MSPRLTGAMSSRVLSGSSELVIDKELEREESLTIHGEFLIKMNGSTDREVMAEGNIERFDIVVKPNFLFYILGS